MNTTNSKEKLIAAQKLLLEGSSSREKFEHLRTLINGLNPKVDKALENCSKALSMIENLKEGDVIELSAVNLPEGTESEKKRKKAILLFIKNYRDLKDEIEQAESQLSESKVKSTNENIQSITKLLLSPKGIFGLITVLAIVIVSASILISKKPSDEVKNVDIKQTSTKIQVIDVDGKKVPLSELRTGKGPECQTAGREVDHYHANFGSSVKAIDGSQIADPGGCGLGKVNEVKIEEIDKPASI